MYCLCAPPLWQWLNGVQEEEGVLEEGDVVLVTRVMMEKRLIVTGPPRLAHVQMAAPHWSDPLVPMELMYNAQEPVRMVQMLYSLLTPSTTLHAESWV